MPVNRGLPVYAKPAWRQALAAASAAHAGLGPASLVLFDVFTLYFETDAGGGFRESGFSEERRVEPQITVRSLTDGSGFPLTVQALEGNKAETATMVPVINAFNAAHHVTDVTGGCRCRDDLRGQPDRPAGGGIVVHPRHANSLPARCGARMARQTPQ